MKKTMKSTTVLAALVMGSLCSLQASAQDNYFALTNNRVLKNSTVISGQTNFFTPTIFTIPSTKPAIDYVNTNSRTMFDANGNVLFSYGENGIYLSGALVTPYGGTQAFAIPESCKTYMVIGTGSISPSHGSYLRVIKVDASAVTTDINNTGLPVSDPLPTYLSSGLPDFNYAAVASPMNANKEHLIYFVRAYGGVGQPVASDVIKYTVDRYGNISPTVVDYNTLLPLINSKVGIARDGSSLGYISTAGDFVTHVIGSGASSYVTYALGTGTSTVLTGIQQVTVGTEKRWYISTNFSFGYIVEGVGGAGSFHQLSTTEGVNSDIAQGADNALYIGSSTGDLRYFSATANPYSSVLLASNALFSSGGQYHFGNNTAGENSDIVTNTGLVYFSDIFPVLPPNSPCTAYAIQIACPKNIIFNIANVTATNEYKAGWYETDSCGNPIASTLNYIDPTWHTEPGPIDFGTRGPDSSLSKQEDKYFTLYIKSHSACDTTTKTSSLRIHIPIWGAKAATWKVTSQAVGGGLLIPSEDCAGAVNVKGCKKSPQLNVTYGGSFSLIEMWLQIFDCGTSCSGTPVMISDNSNPGDRYPAPSGSSTYTQPLRDHVDQFSTNQALYDYTYFANNPNHIFAITMFIRNSCGISSHTGYFMNGSAANCRELNTVEGMQEVTGQLLFAPNPAKDQLTINAWGVANRKIEAALYNIAGQKVVDMIPATTQLADNSSYMIDVQSLPAGMYIYKYSVDGDQKTGKITITH